MSADTNEKIRKVHYNNLTFEPDINEDYNGITLVVGGAATGKTTVLKDAVCKLLDAGIFSSYASLAADPRYLARSFDENGIEFFQNEYAISNKYVSKEINVIHHENTVLSASTDADVIILPEYRGGDSLDLLNIARMTGKPIFVEMHSSNGETAISRLHSSVSDNYGIDNLDIKEYEKFRPWDFKLIEVNENTVRSHTKNQLPFETSEVKRYALCSYNNVDENNAEKNVSWSVL